MSYLKPFGFCKKETDSINLQNELESSNQINQVQINLLSNELTIPIINLLKFSTILQHECFYDNIGEFFSTKFYYYIEKYKIKEESSLSFLRMLQGNDVKIVNDQFFDLIKLAELFEVKLLQKCLHTYALSHSNDIEFNINLILYQINGYDFDNDLFSSNAEGYLSLNIGKCISNENFWKLPISAIYRIIEKSYLKEISSDLLCDLIMKSIKERHILFTFVNIQDLSDSKFNEMYENYKNNSESSKYYEYFKNDLTYLKTLKEMKKSLENEVNKLKAKQISLEEQIDKDNIDLSELIDEYDNIVKQNKEIQIKYNVINQEKQNIEEQLISIGKEKENLNQKYQSSSQENELLQTKNKELEKENSFLHETSKTIYYNIVDALFLTGDNVNKFEISGISINYFYKPVLHFLCELGNVDLVKYFISIEKIDINKIWILLDFSLRC